MASDQFSVAALVQPMEERDRIASARDGDEVASVGRKPAKKIFILNLIQRNLASNVQRQ